MTTSRPEMLLWLTDSHGVYIPQQFAKCLAQRDKYVSGVSATDWAVLEAGPDNESYWDSWINVCDNAVITDENGSSFTIWQDGDCWLIPCGMDWRDDIECFAWPEENEDAESIG